MSDYKIYLDDTVDVAENEQNTVEENIRENEQNTVEENIRENEQNTVEENIRESKSNCKIYPADTVDVYGKVWPTVGENIRNGLFGKLKVGKINIDGKNITSRDFKISEIQSQNFKINKKGVFILIDKVYYGLFFLRFSYSNNVCLIVSTAALENIKADISVLYTEF